MTVLPNGSRGFWLLGWLVLACADAEPVDTAPPTSVRLSEGVVAMVGTDQIGAQTVRRIARAQGVPLRTARELAVRDALFAAGARAQLSGHGLVRSAERALLARTLLEDLKRQAHRAPVTDAEVAEITARHWRKLDRPQSVRTTHAVVEVKEGEPDAPARALAQRLAAAVAGVTDSKKFIQRARAVPAGELSVTAQRLPPVTADGRVVQLDAPPGAPTGHFDLGFAKAANAIGSVGEQSPVVRSKFGYHVILLVERIEEKRVPLPERRKLLRDEIMDVRARRLEDELLERAKQREPVEVLRSVVDLTGRVRVKR